MMKWNMMSRICNKVVCLAVGIVKWNYDVGYLDGYTDGLSKYTSIFYIDRGA